jgi:hypothetical protein
LDERVVSFTSWNLEMVKTNSTENFTSYADIEVRLIVSAFTVNKDGRYAPKYQKNLFRDDDIKTGILKYRHSAMTDTLVEAGEFPDVSKNIGQKKVD